MYVTGEQGLLVAGLGWHICHGDRACPEGGKAKKWKGAGIPSAQCIAQEKGGGGVTEGDEPLQEAPSQVSQERIQVPQFQRYPGTEFA